MFLCLKHDTCARSVFSELKRVERSWWLLNKEEEESVYKRKLTFGAEQTRSLTYKIKSNGPKV